MTNKQTNPKHNPAARRPRPSYGATHRSDGARVLYCPDGFSHSRYVPHVEAAQLQRQQR